MMIKKQVAIIGGDARYLELIKKLICKPYYTIKLIGYDQLDQGFLGVQYTDLDELNPEILDVVILPITGVGNEGNVKSTFSNQSIQLPDDFFTKLKPSSLVFSGINTPYLKQALTDKELTFIPMMERDDVAIYNSVPTAEGAILLALQQMQTTLQDSKCCCFGIR